MLTTKVGGEMIQSLFIENFKKFESIELDLKPFTILMGENGCGKTTLLQAISLALRILTSTDIIKYNDKSRKFTFRKKGVPYKMLPGFEMDDPTDIFYGKNARGGARGGVSPIRIQLTDNLNNLYKLNITSLFGAYTAKNESVNKDFFEVPLLLDCRPLFISGFVGIPSAEERLFPVAMQDRLTKGRASEIIRNLLLDTKEDNIEKYKRLCNKLKTHFNFNIGDIDFKESSDLFVHANFIEKLNKKTLSLDLSSSGSGFLQALQILTPIYRFSEHSKVVLLDEPDSHLHPNLQRTIANVLQEIAEEEKLQIIISTHSTAIIKSVEPENIIPVSSKKDKLKFLNTYNDIDGEISARIDNFFAAKAKIAGKILFVEDKNKKILSFIDSLLGTKIFSGVDTIPIISSQGKDDPIPFRIKESLEKVIDGAIKIYFIRDNDGLPQELQSELLDYSKRKDVELFLLPYHEVENYLLSPNVYSNFLQEQGIIATHEELELIFRTVMEDVISKSRFGFDRTLRDNIYKLKKVITNNYTFQDAEGAALKIRHAYEEITDYENLKKVVPGKEAALEINKVIKEKYGVQVSSALLIKKLDLSDIDDGLKNFLKCIKNG